LGEITRGLMGELLGEGGHRQNPTRDSRRIKAKGEEDLLGKKKKSRQGRID